MGIETDSYNPKGSDLPTCVESQELTYAIDNTGTRFNDVATYCALMSDGQLIPFSQDGSSNNWPQQLIELAASWQQGLDNAGIIAFVEPRFVDNSNPTNISGNIGSATGPSSGLPGAPSETLAQYLIDNGMFWRYLNVQVCVGQPVPVRVFRKTSQLYGDTEFDLASAPSILGPLRKFERCVNCDTMEVEWLKEDPDDSSKLVKATSGEVPKCWEPCGVLALAPPPADRECEFFFSTACDNNGETDITLFTQDITRRTTVCNGVITGIAYFKPDPADQTAILPHTLIGQFVDCATGLPVPGVVLPCEDFEIVSLFSIKGKVPGLRNREWLIGPAVPFSNDDSIGQGILETFDSSLTPLLDTVVTTNVAALNDTSNTAGEMDYQRRDGSLCVDKAKYIRFTTNAEGYVAMWLGKCGGELERVISFGKSVGVQSSPSYLIPLGIHGFRLDNLDVGGSNSSWTVQTSVDGIDWVNDNSLLDSSASQVTPVEVTKKVKVCKPSGAFMDLLTDAEVDKTDCYCDSIDCSGGVGVWGGCS